MEFDPSIYLAIAEIAGVFVGFGALIGVAGRETIHYRAQLHGLITTGLMVILVGLLPVGMSYFLVVDVFFWRLACGLFLLTIWISWVVAYFNRKVRLTLTESSLKSPLFSTTLTSLEVVAHIPLLLMLFGYWTGHVEAPYMLAILINVMQASLFMVMLVFSTFTVETKEE